MIVADPAWYHGRKLRRISYSLHIAWALETYEQQVLERIEIGRQANNAYWIEVNQKNLDERLRPAIAMLKQGQIVAKSEKYEREYTPDEWAKRQAQPAETNEKTT